MRKFKIINLMFLIFAFSVNNYTLDTFADTPSLASQYIPTIKTYNTSDSNTSSNDNNKTTLDGEIGEWDPELKDKPDFEKKDFEMNGECPKDNNYYTISATVPIDMEFYVLPNSDLALGSFYSPTYNIKNNGSKTIAVSIDSFDMMENKEIDSDSTRLYVEALQDGNKKTEIELKMCAVDKTDNKLGEDIDLTKLDSLSQKQKTLYTLSANEEKGFKFDAEDWELPQMETDKEKAISKFRAGFVFSIVRQPEQN